MPEHKVGTQEEWQAERDGLLKEEKELSTDQVPIHPLRLCKEIRDFVDRDSILVVENYPIEQALREWSRRLAVKELHVREQTGYALTVTAVAGGVVAGTGGPRQRRHSKSPSVR